MKITKMPHYRLIALNVALAAGIFLVDLALPLGVAGGVPYIALVLVNFWEPRRVYIYSAGGLGSLLTVLGFFYSPEGGVPWVVLTNRGLALFAIWMAVLICLRLRTVVNTLQESEAKIRTISESARDALVVIDHRGLISFWNPAAERIFGYTCKEANGMNFAELLIPTHLRKSHEQGVKNYFEVGRLAHTNSFLEVITVGKDGRKFPIEISISSIRINNQTAILGIIRDIRERKTAEQQHALLATAVEQAAEAILITDLDGVIEYVNPAFETITGYTSSEVIGENPRILNSGELDKAFYHKLWQTLQAERVWTGHFTNRRKNGEIYEEEGSIAPVRDRSGKVTHYVCVKRDVTHQRALEEHLRQSQKMEALGTLVGGVAHEFNNMLAMLLPYSQMIRESTDLDQIHTWSEKITKSGERAARLARQLLDYSRQGKYEVQTLNLEQEITEVLATFAGILRKDIVVHRECRARRTILEGDRSQIHQVILNLVINSHDAIPETRNGSIFIRTENVKVDGEFARRHEVSPDEFVKLSVIDTGEGIPKEKLNKIFNPFYTTKAKGAGTGLGLSTVQGIVKNHKGFLEVTSELGQGTCVDAYFPCTNQMHISDAEVVTTGTFDHRTILFVDDDTDVRDTTAELLKRLGFTVYVAESGDRAVEQLRDEKDAIDLVLLDMQMPGMNGLQTYQALKEIKPGICAILCSGYGLDEEIQRWKKLGIKGFLRKPFSRRQLSEKILESLQQDVANESGGNGRGSNDRNEECTPMNV